MDEQRTAGDDTYHLACCIVSQVCDRGVSARVDKSSVVKAAGGIGMVLLNVPGGATGVEPDYHALSTVHLAAEWYEAVHEYAASAGATATLPGGNLVFSPAIAAPLVTRLGALCWAAGTRCRALCCLSLTLAAVSDHRSLTGRRAARLRLALAMH